MPFRLADRTRQRLQVMLTPAESYPVLEQAFLAARHEVWVSLQSCDLDTLLRSREGRAIGSTWRDLLLHVLRKGVAIRLVLGDVDSLLEPELHRRVWRTMQDFQSLAADIGAGDQIALRVARHPAGLGHGLRLLLWPLLMRRLYLTMRRLNALPEAERQARWQELPDLHQRLSMGADGYVRLPWWRLPQLSPLMHHQSMLVVDRRWLYIGASPFERLHHDSERAEDRPVLRATARRDVQLLLEGPVVAEAQSHLERFLVETRTEGPLAPNRRFLRTLSGPRRFAPFGVLARPRATEIHNACRVLLRRTTQLAYIETACFQDIGLAQLMVEQARAYPKLNVILVMPLWGAVEGGATPNLAARYRRKQQKRCFHLLQEGLGSRLLVVTPMRYRIEAGKVVGGGALEHERALYGTSAVFDERGGVIASAGLSSTSLFADTEVGVFLNSKGDVGDLRQRMMRSWFSEELGPEFRDLGSARAAWAALAWKNAELAAPDRQDLLLPYEFALAEVRGEPLPKRPRDLR